MKFLKPSPTLRKDLKEKAFFSDSKLITSFLLVNHQYCTDKEGEYFGEERDFFHLKSGKLIPEEEEPRLIDYTILILLERHSFLTEKLNNQAQTEFNLPRLKEKEENASKGSVEHYKEVIKTVTSIQTAKKINKH